MSIHDAPGTITDCHDRERPLKLVTTPAPTAPAEKAPEEPRETRPERRRLRTRLRAVLADDRTRETWRFAVRHGAYVTGGARILACRAWDARTTARYERNMRTAEAAGNVEGVKEWEERAHRFREDRHRRRMELLSSMRQAPKAAAAATGTGLGVLLLLGAGLAWATGDVRQVTAPLMFVVDLLRWAVFIGGIVWGVGKMFLPALALAAFWRAGQQRQSAPRWALPPTVRSDGEPITPSIVVLALRHLGISALRKAIVAMEDGGASMLSPIAIAGCGVELDVQLPLEVSTEEIEKRRRKLAENLGRHEHEVFILKSPQARTVRLWIADSGALDEPIGPSPLVTDTGITADYKNGRAPWGQDLRGDRASISLYQRMLLITGLSNQGKTAALRALALWLAFDPTVEFRIADLKGIGDWRMFQGLATVLIEGPTDDHCIEATEMLEEGVREMNRRLQEPSGTVWRPLILIVDEAQKAFMCPAKTEEWTEDGKLKQGAPYGGQKSTSRYFMAAREIHNQGRAVDVLLWQGTQDPTDQNLPKLVREGAHVRASLVVGTESQARMALSDKAIDGGAAPHLLRQGLDKGTVVVAGDGVELPPGQASLTVRTHFVDTEPDATEVAARAKTHRTAVATKKRDERAEQRDPLKDLAVVVDETRVRTPEVLHRLKNLAPGFYRDWDGGRLRAVLTDAGEDTDTYTGNPVVKRERVLGALARRKEQQS